MAKDFGPKVKIARLYEKVSKTSGNQYFAGRIGLASVVLLKSNETGEGGEPIWNLLVSEPPQSSDRPTARIGQALDTLSPPSAATAPRGRAPLDDTIPFAPERR